MVTPVLNYITQQNYLGAERKAFEKHAGSINFSIEKFIWHAGNSWQLTEYKIIRRSFFNKYTKHSPRPLSYFEGLQFE